MTLIPESSADGPTPGIYAGIESLAGVFHPHAIEVQDFSHYRAIIDLRSAAAFEDDHIPGALHADVRDWAIGAAGMTSDSPATAPLAVPEPTKLELPPALQASVAAVGRDQALLVYCDQGGRVSNPVARALRWRGWTVDVLPGGWINYRRWVLAGLEVLPRLVPFRVIASALGSETLRIMAALRTLGQQVLHIEALAGVRRNALSVPVSAASQPSQAWFDSQLLQALRALDPRAAVWVTDTGARIGEVMLPGALNDALAIAPVGQLRIDVAIRAATWAQDEPLCANADALIETVANLDPQPPPALVAHWLDLARRGGGIPLWSSVLSGHLEPIYQFQRAPRADRQHALPSLQVASMSGPVLAQALRHWIPTPGDGRSAAVT
ncbi:rhodanese-like domain-containing protein [Hydrogenophaga sp.]|uniref:rhodanese-like domain-containing protein n=1 Tax=Hydrogenophaga sp. TaxID=1904254 RepID=UPI00262940F6|nr:rhodanese-like domain-containing protein [Hydrogenophaga sp.]